MRGHKVVPVKSTSARRGKSSGVSGAGGSAAGISSPVCGKGKFDSNVPACTGCGSFVTNEVRALQCDRCMKADKWKCIECLGILPDVYDGLVDCKEICWMCSECTGEALENKSEDKILAMLEKFMDKLCGLEERMQQKADANKLEEFESNMIKQLQQKADLKMLDDLESKISHSVEERLKEKADVKELEEVCSRSYERVSMSDGRKVVASSEVAMSPEEARETEKRKNNVILYRVPEIVSDDVEDRKAGDMAFLHEFCDEGLKVTISNGDIEQMFRLGKREQDKVRPLLVKLKDEELKRKVIGMAKELKVASPRFKDISIAHDLTPQQRERVKEVRKRAMDELKEEQQKDAGSTSKGNVRIIVVGQTTAKPRAVRVAASV